MRCSWFLFERRGLAIFTVRLGPNRVGPDGYLQTAADAVKLLFKEDITPRGADAFMFTLAPIVSSLLPSLAQCLFWQQSLTITNFSR